MQGIKMSEKQMTNLHIVHIVEMSSKFKFYIKLDV